MVLGGVWTYTCAILIGRHCYSAMDCRPFTASRSQCHSVYGKNRGEECLDEELTEKRCLSLLHCPQQANEYYGPASMGVANGASSSVSTTTAQPPFKHQKAWCASWAEAFAYDNELEYGEQVARHHQVARQVVNQDSKMKKECRQIAFDLAKCLRRKNVLRRG
jgi:hypothetical protein